MLKNKKKRMIDIRELYKRGKIKVPTTDVGLEPNSEGFVELDSNGEVLIRQMRFTHSISGLQVRVFREV